MANVCLTTFCVKGNSESLAAAHHLIKEASDCSHAGQWIPTMLREVNIVPEKEAYRCELSYLSDIEDGEFFFDTESAWVPEVDPFLAAINAIDPELVVKYYAEEECMEIYETNDRDHEYFKEYVVHFYRLDFNFTDERWEQFEEQCERWLSQTHYSAKELKHALQRLLDSDSDSLQELIATVYERYTDNSDSEMAIDIHRVETTEGD